AAPNQIKTRDSARQQKAGDGKRAAPAAPRNRHQRRPDQPAPSQSPTIVETYLLQHGLEKISSGIVPQRSPRVQRMLRPDRLARGAHLRVKDVPRKIAEVVRRADLQQLPIEKEQPAERPHREDAEYNPQDDFRAR